jgi:hypothetical protein
MFVGLFREKRYFYFLKLRTIMKNKLELVSFLLLSIYP